MTTTGVLRTIDDVVNDVYGRLAGIQNVLYHKSASQEELHRVWADVQLMAAALKDGDQLLALSIMASIDMELQRDSAINAVAAQRAGWIAFAEKQERRVLAASLSMDKDGIDEDAIRRALDYLAGEIGGDVSEGAHMDAARALQRLGEELNQKGV